jgi:hypothetical protein
MFFKKSREAKQNAVLAARADIILGFQTRLAEAKALADPAERLLKLAEVAEAVDSLSQKTSGELSSKNQNKMFAPYLGAAGTGLGATGALVTFLHLSAAVIGAAALPVTLAAVGIGYARVKRAEKRTAAETKPFFDRLAEISGEAKQGADQVIREHLRELSNSPRSEELLQRVPRLRDEFSAAFMKGGPAQPERRPLPAAGKTALQL